MPLSVQMVVDYVQELKGAEEKLALVVGKPGGGKSKIMRELATNRGWNLVNAKQLIPDELLELVPKVRAQEAPHIINKILTAEDAEVILIDGLQLLFTPLLHLDPLALLRQLSRKRVIVAAWPGQYQDGKLSFLEVGKTKPRLFEAGGLKIIELG